MSSLVEIIKSAAMDAGEAAVPSGIVFGTVMSANPLKIQIDQKLILTEDFLLLTSAVKDHDVEMTISHETEPGGARSHVHSVTVSGSAYRTDADSEPVHAHRYTGKKTFTAHKGLKLGEQVILLRMQGGQKYIVIDRG